MSFIRTCFSVFFALVISGTLPVQAEKPQPLSALAQMPVREVTSFKDGHAFVLHEGKMPTDEHGNVVMDYLPAPVLGTFWTYASDKDVKLVSVTASQHKVLVPRSALNVREFIQANPGAQVEITELRNPGAINASSVNYDAQIIGIPVRSSEELERISPPNSGEKLPEYGDCVLLKTNTGVAAVPLAKIENITFKGKYAVSLSQEEFRNLLTLKLDWSRAQASRSADVGLMYLQKGIRWIPEYKVNIDGKGTAHLKMQATIIDDLTDLNDVTFHLVVGVPSFSFKDNIDPISLQKTLVAVSDHVRDERRFRNDMSNLVMSQSAQMRYEDDTGPAAEETSSGSERNEDLFVYTVKHVSMRKGQRLVLPVHEFDLKYRDVYTLSLPFSPPPEIVQHFNQSQQSEVERLMRAPKFMHKIRLANKSEFPLTTAPALVLNNNRILSQSMMTYTAAGATSDLSLTTAVNLKVKKQDKETQRTPNAVTWQGEQYGRVDLAGTISATNYGAEPADLEIIRYILGKTGSADHDGKTEMVNIFEDYDFLPEGGNPYPVWWGWYSWPNWWSRFNGVGKITWHGTLKVKETIDFGYNWSYFWR